MMKKAIIILLFFAGSTFCLFGQSASLGMDTSANYTNPVSFNSTDNFTVAIKNFGLLTYTGPVQVLYAVDTSASGTAILLRLDSHMVNMTISPNTSYPDTATITISLNNFRSGINTVVIWPRASSTPFTTHDSLKLSLMVNPSAIDGHEIVIRPSVYPNPAQGRLYIQNNDQNFIIEQVRIIDVSGQVIYTGKFNGCVDLSKLSTGFYTLELFAGKGKLVHYKILKE